MSSLESTIPLLLGTLSSLENRRNKNATVSENIVRIRQLITQARNAASKVGLWEGEGCAEGVRGLGRARAYLRVVSKWERELEELWGYQARLLSQGKTPESGLGRTVVAKR